MPLFGKDEPDHRNRPPLRAKRAKAPPKARVTQGKKDKVKLTGGLRRQR